MIKFVLHQVYKTASTVEEAIEIGVPLIFNNKKKTLEGIKNSAVNFNRHTLLHYYIKKCFIIDNEIFFTQRPEDVIEEVFELGFLETQFLQYDIGINFLQIKYDKDGYPITSKGRVQNWYKSNKKKLSY